MPLTYSTFKLNRKGRISQDINFSILATIFSALLLAYALGARDPVHYPPELVNAFSDDDPLVERVILKKSQSAYIQDLHLNLSLPPGYIILSKAHPFLQVYTQKQGLLRKFNIQQQVSTFAFQKIAMPNKLYVDMRLYYCKRAEEGLCLIRNVQFQVPLVRNKGPSDLTLTYTINEEKLLAKDK